MTTDALLATIATLTQTVGLRDEALKSALLLIDKLKVELAYLKRMRYGRSSEQLDDSPQMELMGAMPLQPAANDAGHSPIADLEQARKKRQAKQRPGLRDLPAHLPRQTVVHSPDGGCQCAACGKGLREIGKRSLNPTLATKAVL